MAELLRSKTFWTAVAGIITATGAYFTGEITLATAIQSVFAALVVIFLREGVRKSGPNSGGKRTG